MPNQADRTAVRRLSRSATRQPGGIDSTRSGRDRQLARAFSGAADEGTEIAACDVSTTLDRLCHGEGRRSVGQPIVRLTDMTVVGYEVLTRVDARAVIVLPLRAHGERVGTIVLAHTRPRNITADDGEPLELLVAQFAAMLGRSPQPADH